VDLSCSRLNQMVGFISGTNLFGAVIIVDNFLLLTEMYLTP
jgi:hypothetical protein